MMRTKTSPKKVTKHRKVTKNNHAWHRFVSREIAIDYKTCLYFCCVMVFYCIYLACFDEDIAEFSFNVTDATKIAIEEIELGDFYVVSGSMDWNYPIIRPYGACYNFDELEVSVGNEQIATAEYDPEDGSIVVYGNRPGKTTLTVTEPVSGASTTVEIRVISRIADFFSNLFLDIAFRIMMLIDALFGRSTF